MLNVIYHNYSMITLVTIDNSNMKLKSLISATLKSKERSLMQCAAAVMVRVFNIKIPGFISYQDIPSY